MRLMPTLAACLVLVGMATAQEAAREAALADHRSLVAEFKKANDAYGAAFRKVAATAAYKDAVAARDREKMTELRSAIEPVDRAGFSKKFQDAAARYAPTPAEVPFLSWLVLNGRDPAVAKAAMTTILERHGGSPDLVEVAQSIGRMQRVLGEELQAKAMATLGASPHAMVKANVLFVKGYGLYTPPRRGPMPSAEARAKGRAMLEEAARLAAGTDLESKARSPIFQEERLQIGMEVPDIVGKDLDGVEFKLSDYRGKVVVIDFWGDW